MHRQQEANLLSLQLIFHLGRPLILSSPRSHIFSLYIFLLSYSFLGDFRQFVWFGLYNVDSMELEKLYKTSVPPVRKQKPSRRPAPDRGKGAKQTENEALCMKAFFFSS